MADRRQAFIAWLTRHPRLLWLLELPGAALLYAGWTGDRSGLWDRYGFMGNVLSGFTTAIIGVPFAFFLLQGLLRRNQQQRDNVRRRDLVEIYLQQMHDTLALANPSYVNREEAMSSLRSHLYVLRMVASYQETLIGPGSGSDFTGMTPEEVAKADEKRNEALARLGHLFAGSPGINWADVRSRWTQVLSVLTLAFPDSLIEERRRAIIEEVLQYSDPFEDARFEFSKIERVENLYFALSKTNGLGSNSLSAVIAEVRQLEAVETNLSLVIELENQISPSQQSV